MARRPNSARATIPTALLGLVVVAVSACSSNADGEATTDDGSATERSQVAASETTGAGTSNDEGFTGDPLSPWCQRVPAVGQAGLDVSRLDASAAAPDEVKQKFVTLRTEIDQALPYAPAEIGDAVQRFADNVGYFDDELAAVQYRFAAADQTRIAELNSEISQAAAIIDEYNGAVCTLRPN